MLYNLVIDTNKVSEPEGILDWVVFGLVCFVTFSNLFCLFFVIAKAKSYFPLRSKTDIFLFGIILCGLVNLWGNFISNEHIAYIIPIHRFSCVLWSFWIIFIGLAGWFIFMFMRLLYRSYQFHPRFKHLDEDKKYIICNWTLLLVVIPMISICIYATYFNSSFFDVDTQSCTTENTAKIMVLSWICLCGIGLLITSLILERAIKDEWLTEYQNHRRIIFVAIIITVINIVINLFGLQRYMIGRCIFTSLIAIFHYYCVSNLLYFKIYKCIIKDENYSMEFIGSALALDAKMYSIRELSCSKRLMEQFMDFCIQKGQKLIYLKSDTTKTKLLLPMLMKETYKDFLIWRNVYFDIPSERQTQLISLWLKHFGSKSKDNIKSSDVRKSSVFFFETNPIIDNKKEIQRTFFDKAIEELIENYEQGWGKEYLQQYNKRTEYYELSTSISFERGGKKTPRRGLLSTQELEEALEPLPFI